MFGLHYALRVLAEAKAAQEASQRALASLLAGLPEATAKYHDRLHGIDKRHDEVMRRKS